MKKMQIVWAAVLVLCAAAVQAQDLSGNWQGVLKAGDRELRIVVVLSNTDGGRRAVFYSIDQPGGGGVATSAVTVQGADVKIVLTALNGTFEGRLNADRSAMAGTWTQGPKPVPLTLNRVARDAAWAIPETPPPPKPMAADVDPVFDVATIKPSDPNRPGRAFMVRGRTFGTIGTSVASLIDFAYGVHPAQIISSERWLETDRFDLTAQPAGDGQPNDRQWKRMVQKLLADRFKLTMHTEKRELGVYAITVARSGPKLTKSEGDPNGLPALFFRGLGVLPAVNATMADFAGVLQSAVLDRPVVDHTGLAGRWDFTLTWTPDETQFASLGVRVPPPSNDANAPPGLFTAIQEQLGLKLDSTRAPVDVFVVDRVAHPSEN